MRDDGRCLRTISSQLWNWETRGRVAWYIALLLMCYSVPRSKWPLEIMHCSHVFTSHPGPALLSCVHKSSWPRVSWSTHTRRGSLAAAAAAWLQCESVASAWTGVKAWGDKREGVTPALRHESSDIFLCDQQRARVRDTGARVASDVSRCLVKD